MGERHTTLVWLRLRTGVDEEDSDAVTDVRWSRANFETSLRCDRADKGSEEERTWTSGAPRSG